MTKEQFIEQATVIEDYIAAQREAGDVLNQTFFNGSTSSVFDFGNDLVALAMEQLAKLSGIRIEAIHWYICEQRGVGRHADGFEMNIQGIEDLWDFDNTTQINDKL